MAQIADGPGSYQESEEARKRRLYREQQARLAAQKKAEAERQRQLQAQRNIRPPATPSQVGADAAAWAQKNMPWGAPPIPSGKTVVAAPPISTPVKSDVKVTTPATTITQMPRFEIDRTINSAKQFLDDQNRADVMKDPLGYWQQMERSLGKQGMDVRLQGVYDIYMKYLQPLDGKELVYEMFKSPFDLITLDAMAKQAGLVTNNKLPRQSGSILPDKYKDTGEAAKAATAATGYWTPRDNMVDPKYIPAYNPMQIEAPLQTDPKTERQARYEEFVDFTEDWYNEFFYSNPANEKTLRTIEEGTGIYRKDFTSWAVWDREVQKKTESIKLTQPNSPTVMALNEFVDKQTAWAEESALHATERGEYRKYVAREGALDVAAAVPVGKLVGAVVKGAKVLQWALKTENAVETANMLRKAATASAEAEIALKGTKVAQAAEAAVTATKGAEGVRPVVTKTIYELADEAEEIARASKEILKAAEKAGRRVIVPAKGAPGYYTASAVNKTVWGLEKLGMATKIGYMLNIKFPRLAAPLLMGIEGTARAESQANVELDVFNTQLENKAALEAPPITDIGTIDTLNYEERTGKYLTEAEKLYRNGALLESYTLQMMAADNKEEIIKIQNLIKEEQTDPLTGAPLRAAYAEDLVADGVMTNEWFAELRKFYHDQERDVADQQATLKAMHFASEDMEITGSFMVWNGNTQEWETDERWQSAFDNAQEEWAKQAERAQDNSVLSVFLSSIRAPATEHGWRQLWNSLSAEGKPYVPLKLLSRAAMLPGEVYNGGLASANLMARLANNPQHQGIAEDIIQAVEKTGVRHPIFQPENMDTAVRASIVTEDGKWDMSIGEAMELIESGEVPLETPVGERTLGDLVKAYHASEAKMLEETHGNDFFSTFGNLFGGDYEEIQRIVRENPDAIHAFNMAMDITLQVLMTKGISGLRRPVRRNYDAFMKSNRATRDVSRFMREINDGMAARARAVMQGAHSQEITEIFMRERYKNPTPDMPEIKAATADVKSILERTDLDDAQKIAAMEAKHPEWAQNADQAGFSNSVLKVWKQTEARQAEKTATVQTGHEHKRDLKEADIRTEYRSKNEGEFGKIKERHDRENERRDTRQQNELTRKNDSIEGRLSKAKAKVEASRKKKTTTLQSKLDSDIGMARQRMEAEITKLREATKKRKMKAPERDRLIEQQRQAFSEYETQLRENHQAKLDEVNAPFDQRIAAAEESARAEYDNFNIEVRKRHADEAMLDALRQDRELLTLVEQRIYAEDAKVAKDMAEWDTNHPVPDSKLIDFDTLLARKLAARQKGHGDVIGTKTFSIQEMKARLAEYYGGRFEQAKDPVTKEPLWEDAEKTIPKMNTTRTYYDIFPHLTQPGLKRASNIRLGITRFLADQNHKWGPLKPLAEALYTPLMRAPGLKASTLQADFSDRVFDFVATYSGSIAHAYRWANKAVMTDFTKPSNVRAFEAALHADKARYVKTGEMHSGITQRIDQAINRAGDDNPLLGEMGRTQVGTKMSSKVNVDVDKLIERAERDMARAKTPEERAAAADTLNQILVENGRVGAYKAPSGLAGQVTMGTTRAKYTVRLGRDVMWAPLKTLNNTDAFGHALNWTRTVDTVVGARNASRKFFAAAQTFSTPLRIISVGAGFMNLFGKHSLADTMRSVAEEGLSVVRYKAHKNAYRTSLEKLDPQVRQKVLLDEHAAHEGEYHWQAEGGAELVWTQARAFDSKGHLKHGDEVAQQIRNIVQDHGFIVYAREGTAGLKRWLAGTDGAAWMEQSGAIKRAKALYDEVGEKLTEERALNLARQQYADDMIKLFGDYATFEYLYKDMVKMGKGELMPTNDVIRNSLLEAYKRGENPTVEIAFEEASSTVTGWFTTLTKIGMTPNRVNRGLVFTDLYTKTFKEMKKQGLDDNAAAIIASGVARLRTQQVHFDLSSAMRFEAKHRWYAWFGTKHRLWTTWLAKTAITKPFYAAAFNEFTNWMEDRNANKDIPEWEKYNINIGIGDSQLSINMAPWLWMTSYAQESIIGHTLQNTAIEGFNAIFGTHFQPSPREFDFSLTRLDAPARAIYRRIMLEKVTTVDQVKTQLEQMNPADRRKTMRNMAAIWADSGKTKDWVDCYREVVISGVGAEMHRMLKPASSRIISGNDVKRRTQEREYAELTEPEDRFQYLQDHPEFAAIIGASDRMPLEHQDIVAYYEEIRDLDEQFEAEIDYIWRNGDFFDQDVVQEAWRKYNAARDQIGIDHPDGKADAETYGADDINKIIKFYLPDTENPAEWKKKVGVPTVDDEAAMRKTLTDDFQKIMIAQGMDPTEDTLGINLLKQKMIEEPLDSYMKRDTGTYSYSEENNARWLARSSPVKEYGLLRQTQYLEVVLQNDLRNLWVRGLTNGKPNKTALLCMWLSPDQKEFMGIPTNKETEAQWLQVALAKTRVDNYNDSLGTERASKAGKNRYIEVDKLINEYAANNPLFAMQLNISLMTTVERMRKLGFADGGSNASKGWAVVFDTVDQVNAVAAKVYNKTTKKNGVSIRTATNDQHPESRAKIQELLKRIISLKNSNKDWYTEWQMMDFSLSKFGFFYPAGDGSDTFLWGEHEVIDAEEYEEQWGIE